MPKYDAFGREIGEDSLEGLGWTAGGTVPPAPQPVPRPEPVSPAVSVPPIAQPQPAATSTPQTQSAFDAPPPPPPQSSTVFGTPQFKRVRRRRGPAGIRIMSRLITLVVFVAIAATVVPNITRDIKDATDIKIDLGGDPTPIPFPGIGKDGKEKQSKPAKPPVGLGPRSMIRPAAFRRTMADLRRRELGQVRSLRLAPERIDTQLLTSRGRLRSVQHTYAGDFQQFSLSGGGLAHLGTVPFAKLDPAAPQRLVKAAAERIHKSTSKINYLVASEFDGTVQWVAYFKGGQYFLADQRGEIVRRIS